MKLGTGGLEHLEWTAPEARAAKVWTPKCDVYSLGLLLYRLLTGKRPMAREPASPRKFVPACPATLASALLAVCGTAPSGHFEQIDAMAQIFRPGLPSEPWVVDYKAGKKPPHLFAERTRDCVFVGDTLALVGEAYGYHEMEQFLRDRLFVLRLDTAAKSAAWSVALPGDKLQSGAQAVDVDGEDRLVIGGYTCDDDCKPIGDLRIYDGQHTLVWQASLGHFPAKSFAVQDLAWSPAGYAVVATGGGQGNETAFMVRAFAPSQEEALWTFTHKDLQVLQLALALAIGNYGEVYAGGLGANGYPAVAFIAG